MASKVLTQNDLLNVLAHINLGDDGHMELTQAEFDQLSQEEKDDGTIYFITDGVSGNVFLDDNTPIGTIAPYGGTSDPTYWLICDGRAISRTAYADLFAVIGTTYGTGDGSTTFNIPDLRGRIAQGAGTLNNNTYTLGEQKTAGLPNITGEYRHSWADGSGGGFVTPNGNAENNRGALGNKHSGTAYFGAVGTTSTDNYHANYLTLDASKSSSIYGNSTTVQPNTVITNYIIKASSTLSEHQSHLDFFYPVGSYYETSDATFNPNIRWGGTWELETEGQVHIGAGENYEIGDTGGEVTHILTINEMPSHTHTMLYAGGSAVNWGYNFASSGGTRSAQTEASGGVGPTGDGQAHNNMQPYIVVNRWHRTA